MALTHLLGTGLEVLFFVCLALLYYVYDGYLRLLQVLSLLLGKRRPAEPTEEWPELTVIIAARNEQDRISDRIENILACDYPADRLQIIVASDHSTDATNATVRAFSNFEVELVELVDEPGGKSQAQNLAVPQASGEIIVFTDAETEFADDFLKEIAAVFADPEVGAASGEMIPIVREGSGVSETQSLYWQAELRIRRLESDLGMLVTATGACCAIRRDLFESIPLHIGDDCAIPRLAAVRGYRVVHVRRARAFDRMHSQVEKEFQARVRQTVRNLQGNLFYRQLLNPFKHPEVCLSIVSHKLLRWFSPFLILAMSGAAALLSLEGGWWAAVWLAIVAFYFAGVAGWYVELRGHRLPLVRSVFSFLLANVGFFFGVIGALRGRTIQAYR